MPPSTCGPERIRGATSNLRKEGTKTPRDGRKREKRGEMTDSKEQAEQKGEEVKRARTRWRKRKRESEVRQGEPVIVVGSTKLPGSTTATFDGSNHEDAMTTQSPTSSTTRLSSIGLVAAIYLLLATREFIRL